MQFGHVTVLSIFSLGICSSLCFILRTRPDISLTATNEQLVQTLMLQITLLLQALATLSPSSLKQIQLQILAATMSAAAVPAPAVPSPPPKQAPMSWAGADAAAVLAQFQRAAATAHQGQPAHPTGTLPAVNTAGLQHLLPVAQATTAPPLNRFGMQTFRGVSTNNVPLANSTSIPASSTAQVQVAQSDQGSQGQDRNSSLVGECKIAPRLGTLPMAPRPRQAATTGNNMADLLDKLKQRHAEALEQEARREQAEQACRVSKLKSVCAGGDANSTNSNTSLSHINSSSCIVAGPVAEKVKLEETRIGDGIVALLPFEHATTVSSGSGCTTVDGSTSSSTENLQASDETRNDGSTSSNTTSSYSEEDEDDVVPDQRSAAHRGSVPLRKRFRSENNGGITRRNLEDHNFRMAANDVKNQETND